MSVRDSVPGPRTLELIEAPTRDVAEAQRRALAAEVADKPGFQDALEAIDRIDVDEAPGPASPAAGARDTIKRPAPAADHKTSPSLDRVLAPVPGEAQEQPEAPAPNVERSRFIWMVLGALVALCAGMWLLWAGGAESKHDGAQPSAAPGATASATTQAPLPETAMATAVAPPPADSTTAPTAPTTTSSSSSRASTAARPTNDPSAKPSQSGTLGGKPVF